MFEKAMRDYKVITLMVSDPLWDTTGPMNIIYACNAAHLGRRSIIMSLS